MISTEHLKTVNETAPILAEHGEALTRHFYERMFRMNPEVKPFFNPAHQLAGTQQRALAAAITAYATHLGQPEVLADAVALIAHKHASLGVQPQHYPIVGENLLAAIQEVLDIPPEHPVVQAWAAAYGVLADLLIDHEEGIYSVHDQAHGGRGFAPYRVVQKSPESETITSFYLERVDGGQLGRFQPGQYLSLRLPTPDGSTTMRNYSLSGAHDPQRHRISVKREERRDAPDGYASCYLHHRTQVGDCLEVAGPFGVFTWTDDGSTRPLVLISAGVGITPILAILHAATAADATPRDIVFLHATQNSRIHAFREEVAAIAAAHPRVRVHVCYDQPADGDQAIADSIGRVDAELIAALLPDADVDSYFCGPVPFMSQVSQLLTAHGVATDRQHYECFGPLESLAPPEQRVCPV